jgi:hypothetical protein
MEREETLLMIIVSRSQGKESLSYQVSSLRMNETMRAFYVGVDVASGFLSRMR